MRYQVIFEFQGDDSSMSDVYNYSDEQQAMDKFAELRDSLMHALDPDGCEVTDEPALYSVKHSGEGIFGYVRILTD
jgi:hypothetical protein